MASGPSTVPGRGIRDYYTHPEGKSLAHTIKIGPQLNKTFHDTKTPYKFWKSGDPPYLKEHEPLPNQFPFYRPQSGVPKFKPSALGAQYMYHPPDLQRGEGDALCTTYRLHHGRKPEIGTFLQKTAPVHGSAFPGEGAGFGINNAAAGGVNWLPNKGRDYTTTYNHFHVYKPLNKSVCCIEPNDQCYVCADTA